MLAKFRIEMALLWVLFSRIIPGAGGQQYRRSALGFSLDENVLGKLQRLNLHKLLLITNIFSFEKGVAGQN